MDQTTPQRHAASGFTLIELLAVTCILALLASIALVALPGAVDRSKQRATMADMRTITRAIEAYVTDNNNAPTDSGGVDAALASLVPYQANALPQQDHWGRAYSYDADTSGNYTLVSLGKDGLDGADVSVDTRAEYDRDIVVTNGMFVAAPE